MADGTRHVCVQASRKDRNNMCSVIIYTVYIFHFYLKPSLCRESKSVVQKFMVSKLGSNYSIAALAWKSRRKLTPRPLDTQHWHKSAISVTEPSADWAFGSDTDDFASPPKGFCGICSTYTHQYLLGQGLHWLSKLQGQMLDYCTAFWVPWKGVNPEGM